VIPAWLKFPPNECNRKFNLMTKTILSRIITQSLGLCAAVMLPQLASSQNVNVQFGSASDLSGFNQIDSSGAAANNYSFSGTGGVAGGGGVVWGTTADTTAVYAGASYDLSSVVSITLGIDLLMGAVPTGGANAVAMLGLTAENNLGGFYNIDAASFAGGRIRHASGGANGLQAQSNPTGAGGITQDPSADGGLSAITFTAPEWYRLELTLSRSGTAGVLNYSMSVMDIGADGTGTPTALVNGTRSGTLNNAEIYNDTTLFAAFRGVPGTSWTTAFDNFTVTVVPVPEPGTLAFAGLGMGLWLLRRQKR
jgi:hypothetical protein